MDVLTALVCEQAGKRRGGCVGEGRTCAPKRLLQHIQPVACTCEEKSEAFGILASAYHEAAAVEYPARTCEDEAFRFLLPLEGGVHLCPISLKRLGGGWVALRMCCSVEVLIEVAARSFLQRDFFSFW